VYGVERAGSDVSTGSSGSRSTGGAVVCSPTTEVRLAERGRPPQRKSASVAYHADDVQKTLCLNKRQTCPAVENA